MDRFLGNAGVSGRSLDLFRLLFKMAARIVCVGGLDIFLFLALFFFFLVLQRLSKAQFQNLWRRIKSSTIKWIDNWELIIYTVEHGCHSLTRCFSLKYNNRKPIIDFLFGIPWEDLNIWDFTKVFSQLFSPHSVINDGKRSSGIHNPSWSSVASKISTKVHQTFFFGIV